MADGGGFCVHVDGACVHALRSESMAQTKEVTEPKQDRDMRVRVSGDLEDTIKHAKAFTGITNETDLVRHALTMLVREHRKTVGT